MGAWIKSTLSPIKNWGSQRGMLILQSLVFNSSGGALHFLGVIKAKNCIVFSISKQEDGFYVVIASQISTIIVHQWNGSCLMFAFSTDLLFYMVWIKIFHWSFSSQFLFAFGKVIFFLLSRLVKINWKNNTIQGHNQKPYVYFVWHEVFLTSCDISSDGGIEGLRCRFGSLCATIEEYQGSPSCPSRA